MTMTAEHFSRLHWALPFVAAIIGAVPAGILHRGLGVGPYISIAVGIVVTLAVFHVLDERQKRNRQEAKP